MWKEYSGNGVLDVLLLRHFFGNRSFISSSTLLPYPSSVVNISFSVRIDTSVSSGNDDGIDSAIEDRHRDFAADSAAEHRSISHTDTSLGQFTALRGWGRDMFNERSLIQKYQPQYLYLN